MRAHRVGLSENWNRSSHVIVFWFTKSVQFFFFFSIFDRRELELQLEGTRQNEKVEKKSYIAVKMPETLAKGKGGHSPSSREES